MIEIVVRHTDSKLHIVFEINGFAFQKEFPLGLSRDDIAQQLFDDIKAHLTTEQLSLVSLSLYLEKILSDSIALTRWQNV